MASRRTRAATSSGENGSAAPPGAALALSTLGDGLLLGVRLSPSAPRTLVLGTYGRRLKVAVNAPPEDNRANRQLVKALANWLRLPRSNVTIVSGHASRDKVVAFKGIREPELRDRLAGLVSGNLSAKG